MWVLRNSRNSRSRPKETTGAPTVSAAHEPASVIQSGNSREYPGGASTCTISWSRSRVRRDTARVCPRSGCQRYSIVTC